MLRTLLLAIALCLSGGRESFAEGVLVTGFRIDSMECMEGYKLTFEKIPEQSKPMHPLLAKVKAARTRDQLRQALLPFTTGPSLLDSLFQKAGTDESGEMEDPTKLKRAESFAFELDTLPGPEYVSQIVFESEAEYQGTFARAYIVSVHRVLDGKPDLAFGTGFGHVYCGMSQRGGMTFAFRVDPAHPKRSRVLFNHDLVESCGLVLAGARRTDTLSWDGPAFRYIRGPRRDESMTDRSNPEAYGE